MIEKSRQKKCGRKIVAEKVRQKNHGSRIVAKKPWKQNAPRRKMPVIKFLMIKFLNSKIIINPAIDW